MYTANNFFRNAYILLKFLSYVIQYSISLPRYLQDYQSRWYVFRVTLTTAVEDSQLVRPPAPVENAVKANMFENVVVANKNSGKKLHTCAAAISILKR
jgi:hypothetical protein